MDKKLQPYLDKMRIVFKEPCKKWDMDRYHYGIKIWDEVFNYYGSAKEFEDEKRCIEYAIHTYWKSTRSLAILNRDKTNDELLIEWAKWLWIKLQTDDEIKTNALYCLVMDYWTYEDYSMEDFIDEFGYKTKEWIMIYKELEINNNRMENVFTIDELRLLQELYQDF